MTTSARRKRSKYLARTGLAALALGLSSLGATAQADTAAAAAGANTTPAAPDKAAQKQRAIRALIKLTDAARVEALVSQRFIGRIADAVALFRPDIDAHTMTVIKNQARAVIREHIESGDALYAVLYPVYEKHFNLIELNKLLNFYHSPLGQKLVRLSPELVTESLNLGSQWALSLVPEILDRVAARLPADSAANRNSP